MIRGQVRDHFSWLHTDVASYTVYFNLNNPEHEIAKITPDEIQIMKNGGNEDGIILDGSRKMKPLRFLPDADLEEADRLLVDLLVGNMTCPQGDRFLILSWLSCFLLIDFAGTPPLTVSRVRPDRARPLPARSRRRCFSASHSTRRPPTRRTIPMARRTRSSSSTTLRSSR